jgi:hypothetical protein
LEGIAFTEEICAAKGPAGSSAGGEIALMSPEQDAAKAAAYFLIDPHFGGDGPVMVIRHRDPDKTWTIRQPVRTRMVWPSRRSASAR